jgi:mRNA interferase RelE/StbE
VGQAEQIYSREFDSIFFKLDQRVRQQIESKITEAGSRLAQYPHHRLKGRSEFRLRVGDYRIIYEFDLRKNVIYLIALGHRREIYR